MQRSPLMIDFGKRLQQIRVQAKMTQEDLSAATGLHQVTISLIEGGRRSVTIRTIEKLARGLGVQPRDLMPPLRESGRRTASTR